MKNKIFIVLLATSLLVGCGSDIPENTLQEIKTTSSSSTETIIKATTSTKAKETQTAITQKKTSPKEKTTETKTNETTTEPSQNNTTGNSNGGLNNHTGNTQNYTPSYETTYEPEESQYEEPYYEESSYEPETPQNEASKNNKGKTIDYKYREYKNRTYTKCDITNNDSIAAVFAMRQLSDELAIDLFNGCESPKHTSLNAANESFAIIIALNYNQNINLEMLGDYYYSESYDEFNEELDMLDLAKYQYDYNTKVDFNKYVLDEDLANFINNISEEYREYRNGSSETLSEEINNYFEENSGYINDYVKYYFMCNTKKSLGWDDSQFETARQLYFEEVTTPLFNKFESDRHRVNLHG